MKKSKQIECIAYLSTTGSLDSLESKERRQERYIREYAKANNIKIVGVVRRNGLSQRDVNRQFESILALIRKNQVKGLIIANMDAISIDTVDAYTKVGKIHSANGVIVTVDEGILRMNLRRK